VRGTALAIKGPAFAPLAVEVIAGS
jgi:hypothetical protein